MKRAVAHGQALILGVLVLSVAAAASEIGQQIASRINVATYRYYLDGRLYTHDGDDRGTEWFGFGPEHDLARDNIAATFQGFGLSVELQGIDVDGLYYNVVATQLGTVYPDSYYVIGAHYDSVGNPGADDDASGVAGLLEIARVLSLYATEYTIKYIAFDQEEMGLVGSFAYVQDHLADDIRGMIQLDMIAHNNGQYGCEIYGRPQSDPLKLALADAINLYGNGLTAWVYGQHDSSDHAPFEWAGFQACEFTEAFHGDNPCYHYACDSVDTPDYISYNFAADFVRSTAGFLADQAGAQPLFDCDSGAGCEPGTVGDEDCNGNGVWDVCDVICGGTADCNANLIPDECDLAGGASADCNQNGVPDECDLASGTSEDFNRNGMPDECEPNRTWYVDDDAPADPGPGIPWISDPLEDGSAEHPYDAIQEAIRASISGDAVLVRAGMYVWEGNVALEFGGRAIWLAGEDGPQNCIVDCLGIDCGLNFHHSETGAAHVSGLTIRGGAEDLYPQTPGAGGIYCYRSSPTIENCVLTENFALNVGAAISCDQAHPTIIGCDIIENTSQGGAIYCYEADPLIIGTTITDNSGPGIFCIGASPTVGNCIVARNDYGIGGWVCAPSVTNCTIAANAGGGVTWQADDAALTNCVIWGNIGPALELQSGNCAVTFCDMEGGWPGAGNIDADPLFVAPASGDFHLSEFSPCLNAGDPDGDYTGQTDIDGDPRVLFGRVDIGADEVAGPDCNGNGILDSMDISGGTSPDCNWNGIPDECELANGTSLDCNGNGIPDECDLANCISTDVNGNGIPDECESVGDLNCDGTLDLADINPFVLFLSNYAGWLAEFPGCDPLNGDINGDGTYGQESLADINPFVELLTHP